jgi:hypothetical protein
MFNFREHSRRTTVRTVTLEPEQIEELIAARAYEDLGLNEDQADVEVRLTHGAQVVRAEVTVTQVEEESR